MKSLNEVFDYDVEALDGTIGKPYGVLFDDRFWTSRYVVVDTNTWLPLGHKFLLRPALSINQNI